MRHGQPVVFRPGLDHKSVTFRQNRGDRGQLAVESVLFCQEDDPPVRENRQAVEGVCDVVINCLTGPTARPDGNDHRLAAYIERRIVEDGYSPAAVLGEIKVKGIQFDTTICEATLYSYIKKGVFLTLEAVHLPRQGMKKRQYKKVKKTAARASAGRSIEKRSPEIDTRAKFGHWEMDCVEGKKKTKETLLVLSERKARKEIMVKMKDKTTGSVVAALDRLERKYGKLFSKVFQTITVDNGTEFSDVAGLERSCRHKGKRTTVFYCHPYSSYERGTNENINGMIRRWFPKGTDFGKVPAKAIQAVEDWLNSYPRGVLGFRCADDVFAEALADLV